MPIEVEGPDGAVIEFPDNTDQTTIRRVMAQRYNKGKQEPKPAPKPAPKPRSVGDTAMNSLAAVGGALFRGAAALPDLVAAGGEAVGDAINAGAATVGGGILRAGGATGAARKFEQFVAPNRQAPRFRVADIPDRLGTPRPTSGGVEFAGNLLGGAAVPLPAAKPNPIRTIQNNAMLTAATARRAAQAAPAPARSAAQEVIEQGQKRGVRVLTTDVRPPSTAIGRKAQQMGEQIPFVGTGGTRAAQQTERVEAVKAFVRETGGDDVVKLFDEAPTALDDVAKSLTNKRAADLTRFTAKKRAVIEGTDGIVPVDRTSTAIGEQIERLKGLKLPELNEVITKLEGWRTAIQGQSLTNIESIRKSIGNAFKSPDLAHISDEGQKSLNAIYAPMNAEMGTFIRNRAGERAFREWGKANETLAAMAGELDNTTLKNVLKTSDMTPENVGKLLFSRNRSDVARLYANLDTFGRRRAQAAVIQRAFDKAISADGGLSVERFSHNMKALSTEVGVTFKGIERANIEGFVKLLDATRRAAAASVAPATGAQNTPIMMGIGLTQLAGLWGGAALAGIGGAFARAYESAVVRNALIRAAKSPAGSRQEAIAIDRAAAAIASVIAANKDKIAAVANEPVGVPLAASDGQEQQQEQ